MKEIMLHHTPYIHDSNKWQHKLLQSVMFYNQQDLIPKETAKHQNSTKNVTPQHHVTEENLMAIN